MSRIEVKTTVEGKTLKVILVGAIDETFSQSSPQIPKAENIEFNLYIPIEIMSEILGFLWIRNFLDNLLRDYNINLNKNTL